MDWLDLPELALIRVLNCLPLHDQLNARLVCRHWKRVTDSSARKDELVLFLEIYPRPVYWFHDGREVDLGNAFLISNLEALKNEFFLSYFCRVSRLMIAHRVNASSNQFVEQIQSFLQLEHLQFCSFGSRTHLSCFRNLVYETNLHLPNLRTFYSHAVDRPRKIHCPKLTELFIYSELTIDDRTDEQTKLCIQNLRLLLVWRLVSYPKGFEFSNLEVFYFNRPCHPILLSDFPRLKEIHYFHTFGYFFELPNHLKNLLKQKRRLKRNQLRIYFDGFELEDKNGFKTLSHYLPPGQDSLLSGMNLNEHILRLVQESPSFCKFDLLSKRLLVNEAVYEELIDLPTDDLLVESMLKSTIEVTFEQPLSTESLNFFYLSDRLRNISCVRVSLEMSQTQLDLLPDALPHLVNFFYDPKFFGSHILNFQFVGRFKSLQFLTFYYRLISMDELRLVFEKCKFLYLISLARPNKAYIRIFRPIGEKVYKVNWRSSDRVDFAEAKFSMEELFDYLEASRWLEKHDFLGERVEVEPAPLLLRPPNEND